MKLDDIQIDDYIVALNNVISYEDENSVLEKGKLYKVILQGQHQSKKIDWAFKLGNIKSYFEATTNNFRKATSKEISRFKLLGDMYVAEVPKFEMGDTLRAISDVTTVDGEFTVDAESENIIEDVIINRKNIDESIFWFNNHSGVFKMSDNFEKIINN